MFTINETHAADLSSWVASANRPGADFPIQNLPFAVFRDGSRGSFRGGVAIGDQVVDLRATAEAGLFSGQAGEAARACSAPSLNAFMQMAPSVWSALRSSLSDGLRTGSKLADKLGRCLVARSAVEYAIPASIGDYTDFYTSIHHATNIGKLFRPDNPLLPNYQWVPIGYHGRSSSITVSGQPFHRPIGQTRAPEATAPSVGPCRLLDYEMEVGIFVGGGNKLGQPIDIDDADDHVFGLCLLNDWSARDIQAWEYQPLGPFLSKNFATTVSPWVVTLEALAPYRTKWTRPADQPQPLPYLESVRNRAAGAFDIKLEARLETERMRREQHLPPRLSLSNFRYSYWTVAQMMAHHTINGCNVQAGDLFGSGTMSGPDPSEAGALIEITHGGKQPITLDNGESRTFLEDGDCVIMCGWCEKQGAPRIGFGKMNSIVLPALTE